MVFRTFEEWWESRKSKQFASKQRFTWDLLYQKDDENAKLRADLDAARDCLRNLADALEGAAKRDLTTNSWGEDEMRISPREAEWLDKARELLEEKKP